MAKKFKVGKPKSLFSESIKSLKTNLQFLSVDKRIKSILFTSPSSGEGKSTVTINLAIELAKNDKKVIIVDADIRRPMVHNALEMPNEDGLTTILLNVDDYKKYIIKHEDFKIDIITAGVHAPNPVELLDSNAMSNLLGKLYESYDYILVDTPPIGLVTDAAVLSVKVDGVILVCALNETDERLMSKSKESLEFVNANILGVVINKEKKRGNIHYRTYYGSKYGKKKKS